MKLLGRTSRNLVVALIAIGAVVPMPASAQQCPGTAPSDISQVDEYTESIPGACGNEPTNPQSDDQAGAGGGGTGGGGSSADPAIPEATVEQLESLGDDGAAAAALAQSTAPQAGSDGRPPGQGSSAGSGAGSSAGGGSVVSGIRSAVGGEDDGGVGILLPVLLGSVLLAGIAYLVRRRMRTVSEA